MAEENVKTTSEEELKAKADAVKKQNASEEEAKNTGKENSDKKQRELSGNSFFLKIYSPYKVYFEGAVESVTAENLTGVFDILKGHKNFLTLLTPYELNIKSVERGDEKLKINRGVMHVKADEVVIFLDV